MNADEFEETMAKATSRPERNLWLGAILSKQVGVAVVIVGGSAIEVYTSGKDVSGDIDVVGDRNSIIKGLETWGFQPAGRLWSRKDLELWIDPVGKWYTGDERRLRTVTTPYGPVRLASIEDLIAKRLIETKVWPKGETDLFAQALALAAEYSEEIDWEYVTEVASRDLAEDLVPELRPATGFPPAAELAPVHGVSHVGSMTERHPMGPRYPQANRPERGVKPFNGHGLGRGGI